MYVLKLRWSLRKLNKRKGVNMNFYDKYSKVTGNKINYTYNSNSKEKCNNYSDMTIVAVYLVFPRIAVKHRLIC